MSAEFINYLEGLVGDQHFQHFYLVKHVLSVNSRNIIPSKVLTIGNEEHWIVVFCAEGQFHIYGNNWVDSQLLKFLDSVDFSEIPDDYFFSGNRFLIEYLMTNNESVEFITFKNREFYETKKKLSTSEKEDLKIGFCTMEDLDEVSEMNCSFFEEEYNGENNKDLDEMKADMISHILDKKFFVAKADNELVGFCIIMDTVFDNSMIGTIYIKPKYRSKGYGLALLHNTTDFVLTENLKCWLMTDEANIPSNNMVLKIGYARIFQYTSGNIKKL